MTKKEIYFMARGFCQDTLRSYFGTFGKGFDSWAQSDPGRAMIKKTYDRLEPLLLKPEVKPVQVNACVCEPPAHWASCSEKDQN